MALHCCPAIHSSDRVGGSSRAFDVADRVRRDGESSEAESSATRLTRFWRGVMTPVTTGAWAELVMLLDFCFGFPFAAGLACRPSDDDVLALSSLAISAGANADALPVLLLSPLAPPCS
jgi:hypothetical protein